MPSHTTDTKSHILETARTLYSTHGCDNTTLEDIITSAGITKGAFYYYFKSKESLCEEVIDRAVGDYRQLAASIDPELKPLEQLHRMIGALAELNASGKWVNCRLILRLSLDSHQSNPAVQRKIGSFWQWYRDFYKDLITRCRDAGQLATNIDTDTQVNLLTSVMAGAIMLEKTNPDQSVFGESAARIIEMLQEQT